MNKWVKWVVDVISRGRYTALEAEALRMNTNVKFWREKSLELERHREATQRAWEQAQEEGSAFQLALHKLKVEHQRHVAERSGAVGGLSEDGYREAFKEVGPRHVFWRVLRWELRRMRERLTTEGALPQVAGTAQATHKLGGVCALQELELELIALGAAADSLWQREQAQGRGEVAEVARV